jgi:formiminotetrahydrofolate cyclodeaminase
VSAEAVSPGDGPIPGRLVDEPLGRFLDRVAARQPAPGGGAAAAVAVAMAASLTSMAARFSCDGLMDETDTVSRAEILRLRVVPLAQADGEAYSAFLTALRMPEGPDPKVRRVAIRIARDRAAEVPLTVAELGADVAALAAQIAESGNPKLRGDALTAALLAEAGARAAAGLVEVNVGKTDPRSRQAAAMADQAGAAARRAAAAGH